MKNALYKPILALAAIFFFGVIAVQFLNLYRDFPNFDSVMHVFGGMATAWLFVVIFKNERTRTSVWTYVVLISGATALVGIAWEVAEYLAMLAQYALPTLYKYFHGGSLGDTILDLVLDVSSSVIVALFAYKRGRED